MIAITFVHTYTEYLRKVLPGGMDSDYAGTRIATREYTIVAPDRFHEEMARVACRLYGGNDRDPNFGIKSVRYLPITAIIDLRKTL